MIFFLFAQHTEAKVFFKKKWLRYSVILIDLYVALSSLERFPMEAKGQMQRPIARHWVELSGPCEKREEGL